MPDFEYENKTSDKQKNNLCPNQQDSIQERGTEPNLTNQGSSKIDRNEKSNKLDIVTVENEIIRQIIYSKINKNIPISVISNLKFDKNL